MSGAVQRVPPGQACISIRQPWAWAIIHAGKTIENRGVPWPWRERVGERIYLHAAKGCTFEEFHDGASWIKDAADVQPPALSTLPRGAIIGSARLVAVIPEGDERNLSPWTIGPWCLVLDEVRASSRPLPWQGRLGWFGGPPDLEAAIAAWVAVEGDDA